MRGVELRAGDRLGRFEVLFPLATGGMASVYVGRHVERVFRRPVALKVVLPHLSQDQAFVDMFLDEAGIATTIQSPNVVQTLDVTREDDGTLSMAMELIVGGSLRELLSAGRPSTAVALSILRDLARGLRDTHEACSPTGVPLEIVHRDVSPHNVLVGQDGVAKLADFGIARATGRISRTETGQLKGKMAYLSPEQVRSQPVDGRSDIFAFGAVAWEALVGKPLFPSDNPLSAARQIMLEPIPEIAAHADLPAEVAALIDACLVREVDGRVTSTKLVDALEALPEAFFASRAEVGAYVDDVLSERIESLTHRLREAFSPPPAQPAPAASVPSPPPRRGGRVAGALGAAIVALVVATAGYLVATYEETPRAAASERQAAPATIAEPAAPEAPARASQPPAPADEPPTRLGALDDVSAPEEPPPPAVEPAPDARRIRRVRRRPPPADAPPAAAAEQPAPQERGVRLLGREHFDRQLGDQ